ncbi:hypothetical protein [Cupriavidus sp. CuC1]|uniref:hypothetical protein n=1 Tax=Cupriavidus sp. CuC1 TaxID=3373131 RepID=UPI0037DCD305
MANLLGLKTASYLSQLASGHRPIKEDRARSIEEALKLSEGWMDIEHEEPKAHLPAMGAKAGKGAKFVPFHINGPQQEPPASNLVTDAVLSVGALLEDAGLEVSPAKFATIVNLALENASPRGAISEDYLRKIISLLNVDEKPTK